MASQAAWDKYDRKLAKWLGSNERYQRKKPKPRPPGGERPVDAVAVLKDVIDSIGDSSTEAGIAQTRATAEASRDQAEWNLAQITGSLPHDITEVVLQDADALSDHMRAEIRQDVDALMGDGFLSSLMSQVGEANADVVDIVSEFLPQMQELVGAKLRGEVSSEQQRQFETRVGEDVLRMYGRGDSTDPQARGRDIAGWLGIVDQNQQQGLALAPGLAQFAGLPITSAADVTNVMNQYRTPLANAGAMQQNLLSLAVQQGTVSPDVTMQVGANMIVQNMQQQMAGATSMLNYQSDQNAAYMAMQGAMAGADATRSAGLVSAIGQGLGTAAGIAITKSDRRLKQDISQVGVLPNGLNVYKFRYKWGGPEHIGLMADEVKLVHPEAVIRVGEYDAVDYGKAVL